MRLARVIVTGQVFRSATRGRRKAPPHTLRQQVERNDPLNITDIICVPIISSGIFLAPLFAQKLSYGQGPRMRTPPKLLGEIAWYQLILSMGVARFKDSVDGRFCMDISHESVGSVGLWMYPELPLEIDWTIPL